VRFEGTAAVLKTAAREQEHLVLRRWGGTGAVRLLRADPHRRALLLERLRPESLETLDERAACAVVVDLYRLLHVPAMPQLPSVATLLPQWAEALGELPRGAPVPHRLVEQAAALCRELAGEPADQVLHGNLHYGNVLAAARTPWLAISPDPVNGTPAYELAPMLWSRWDDIAGDVRGGVQRRFYTLIDAAGFYEDLARAWVLVRVARAAVAALDDPVALTKYVALSKAVQN